MIERISPNKASWIAVGLFVLTCTLAIIENWR